MNGNRNPVAKFAVKFNRCTTFVDRKKEANRKACRKGY